MTKSLWINASAKWHIQCIRKVFRPLDFLHILLRYSLILKLIKNKSSIYTQYPIMKGKTGYTFFANVYKNIKTEISHLHKYSDRSLSTLLKHLWQWLQPWVFLGMTLQAWHTSIWGVSHVLLCRSSQALSGWMGSIAAQLFSGLSRDVRLGSSSGSGWALKDIQRLVPKLLLHCLGCELRVVVLLEGEPSPQSEVLSSLEQVFIKDLYFAPFIFPQSWLLSQSLPLKSIPTAWCCYHHASP